MNAYGPQPASPNLWQPQPSARNLPMIALCYTMQYLVALVHRHFIEQSPKVGYLLKASQRVTYTSIGPIRLPLQKAIYSNIVKASDRPGPRRRQSSNLMNRHLTSLIALSRHKNSTFERSIDAMLLSLMLQVGTLNRP